MKRIYSAEPEQEYILEMDGECNYKVVVEETALTPDAEDSTFELEECFASYDDAIKAADEYVTGVVEEFPDAEVEDDEVGFIVTVPDEKIVSITVSEVDGVSDVDENPEIEDDVEDDVPEELEESVVSHTIKESARREFARRRKLFEDEEDDKPEDKEDEDDAEGASEEKEHEDKTEEGNDDAILTAVVLTVAAKDVDACKEELENAGIDEKYIDVLADEKEDDDDENKTVDIKIDADAVMELKDYLAGKKIDLEKEIGGELVSDEDDETKNDEEGGEEDKDGDEDETDLGFGDMGDIFGDDEDSADEK